MAVGYAISNFHSVICINCPNIYERNDLKFAISAVDLTGWRCKVNTVSVEITIAVYGYPRLVENDFAESRRSALILQRVARFLSTAVVDTVKAGREAAQRRGVTRSTVYIQQTV